MLRLGSIIWLCLGALGLGIVVLQASKQKKDISGWWFFLGVLLGPIFLCFVVPMWLGKWGDKKNENPSS